MATLNTLDKDLVDRGTVISATAPAVDDVLTFTRGLSDVDVAWGDVLNSIGGTVDEVYDGGAPGDTATRTLDGGAPGDGVTKTVDGGGAVVSVDQVRLLVRRATNAAWAASSDLLWEGELGITLDAPFKLKIGRNQTWASTQAYLDQAWTAADKAKLDGIESSATADQTGPEIITLLNSALGSTTWQTGGGSMSASQIEAALDAYFASTAWKTHPDAAEIEALLDTRYGGTTWRAQLTGAQVVTAINGELGGTTWQAGGTSLDVMLDADITTGTDTTQRSISAAQAKLAAATWGAGATGPTGPTGPAWGGFTYIESPAGDTATQTATIQTALNTASGGTKWVTLGKGSFVVSYLVIPSGVSLDGLGPALTTLTQDPAVFAADGTSPTNASSSTNAFASAVGSGLVAGSTITVANLSFTHPRPVVISPVGDVDLSDIVFQISGTSPDHTLPSGKLITDNPGFSSVTGGVPNATNTFERLSGPRQWPSTHFASRVVGSAAYSGNIFTGNVRVKVISIGASGGIGTRQFNIGFGPTPIVRTKGSGNWRDGFIRNMTINGGAGNDACGLSVASTSVRYTGTNVQGDSTNGPHIRFLTFQNCARGLFFRGGIHDSSQPVQRPYIEKVRVITTGQGTATVFPGPKYAVTMGGQCDTFCFNNLEITGPGPGIGQPSTMDGVALYLPDDAGITNPKGGSGLKIYQLQLRFMGHGVFAGTGKLRGGTFDCDFENIDAPFYIGNNNRGVVIMGAFAHAGGFTQTDSGNSLWGSQSPFLNAGSGASVAIVNAAWEGYRGYNDVLVTGRGAVDFVGPQYFTLSAGSTPPIGYPKFDQTLRQMTIASSALTFGAAGMPNKVLVTNAGAVTNMNLPLAVGRTVTLILSGATTFQASGNIATPDGTDLVTSSPVTVQAELDGASTGKLYRIVGGVSGGGSTGAPEIEATLNITSNVTDQVILIGPSAAATMTKIFIKTIGGSCDVAFKRESAAGTMTAVTKADNTTTAVSITSTTSAAITLAASQSLIAYGAISITVTNVNALAGLVAVVTFS